MLIEFRFKNSRSFYEEQQFSMVASKLKDLTENVVSLDDIPSLKKVSTLKSSVIYGSNASGKSSFIYTLLNALLVIKESFKSEPDKGVFRQSFNSKKRMEEDTSYYFDFIVNKTRYIYSFSCNFKYITNESLIAYPNGKPQDWFSRCRNADGTYSWKINSALKKEKGISELTMENVLFLSRAATLDSQIFKPIYDWFVNGINVFILSSGMDISSEFTDKIIVEDPVSRFELLQFMKKADFGISEIKVNENNNLLTAADRIRFMHAGIDVPFTKSMESSGTNRLFNLWSVIRTALEKGLVFVVDELENSLHPLLLLEIINLFNSASNTNGAQLIFTSHSPFLMARKVFRRDQIWFCEKDERGESSIFPLSDFNIRNDFSIDKGYLSGRFGAIPNIEEPLM